MQQTVYLHIYFDDFNKLKKKTIHTKLACVYLAIANLPYTQQSKRDQILLSLVCKRNDLKGSRNKLEIFFEPLISAIQEINADPIILDNNYSVKIKLCSSINDNLAANELTDVSMCFRWDACRYCMIKLDQIADFNRNEKEAEARILSENHIYKEIQFEGILYSPDLFHDLNEGCIEFVINALLIQMQRQERVNLLLNAKALKIHFKGSIVSGIVDGKISGTGMEKYDFFVLFSIFYCQQRNTNLYKLFLLLRKIVNFALSPFLEKDDLLTFELDCKKFNLEFSKIFRTDKNKKPSRFIEKFKI